VKAAAEMQAVVKDDGSLRDGGRGGLVVMKAAVTKVRDKARP